MVCQWFGLKTTRTVSHRFGPQNRWRLFVSGLALKPVERFLAGLASKSVVTVSGNLASKPAVTVSSGLALKPVATVSSSLASKPAATVFSGLASKPVVTVFSCFTSKLVTTVSPGLASKPVVGFLVEPQNQGDGGFPGLGLKTGSFSLVIWASKSSRRFLGLGSKLSRLRFVGCATKPTEGGRRGTHVEI
jgi:hypothetical protein